MEKQHQYHDMNVTEMMNAMNRLASDLVNLRIRNFMPPASDCNSLCNRSLKPCISVDPPVTTMLLKNVACKSGSIWTSAFENRRDSGCSDEYGWEGIVEADVGNCRLVNCCRHPLSARQKVSSYRDLANLLGQHSRVEKHFGNTEPHRSVIAVVAIRKLERPCRPTGSDTMRARESV